jgi:AcrR family transcriptional regulator
MSSGHAKSPRRQPKQARARDTVEVVLDAAARVLREHGYAGGTTNRIADAAGVSVGTVYEYFENKEAIFDSLIRREIALLVAAFQTREPQPDASLPEVLRGLIASGMAAMPYGPELFRALEAVPGTTFRRHLADGRKLVVELVESVLETHRAGLRVTDLGMAAFVVVSAIEGVGANAASEMFDERLADELTSLVALYLTGAEPLPTRGG